jgi:hypothetical protein
MKTKKENQMEWLQNEIKKDTEDLSRKKLDFIEKIKGVTKIEIIPVEEKMTLWQRIKIVLKIH